MSGPRLDSLVVLYFSVCYDLLRHFQPFSTGIKIHYISITKLQGTVCVDQLHSTMTDCAAGCLEAVHSEILPDAECI
jgi:hypothetical protein